MVADNVSDSNKEDEIHRLNQDTFAPMDEDNQDDSHDVDPLLHKSRQPLYEGSTKNILYNWYLANSLIVHSNFFHNHGYFSICVWKNI